MARTKQTLEYEIEVGGEPYIWRLQRRPQESGKASERSGMALAVRHKDGQREAVLEFPPGPQPKFGAPQLLAADTPSEIVARAIASAIEAGWDPLSRGRKIVIVVDANGG
jgi:hypothetical protein